MNKNAPRFLNLFSIHFPFTAIVSFLHRLSGIFTFFIIPFFLWIIDQATRSPAGFDDVQRILSGSGVRLLVWISFVALFYHFLAGIRHLYMDLGHGESLRAAKISGITVMVLAFCAAILMGIRLW